VKTIKSIGWRAEQKALKQFEKEICTILTERIAQLQQWIEDEENPAEGKEKECLIL
jgi:hypothetical protein